MLCSEDNEIKLTGINILLQAEISSKEYLCPVKFLKSDSQMYFRKFLGYYSRLLSNTISITGFMYDPENFQFWGEYMEIIKAFRKKYGKFDI